MATKSKRPQKGKKPTEKVSARKRMRIPGVWMRRLFMLAGIGLGLMALMMYLLAREAGAIDISQLNMVPERTQIYDVRGRTVGVLHGENRIFVPLQDVPIAFKEALLAREDNRFYLHDGVDWFGVVRAAFRNVKEREIVQGASTLTMQLARNRFDLSGKNFQRKFIEALLSRRLEKTYSKDQILEAYLNIVYFGAGQYGLEQASRNYFEKQAKDLTLSEAALLVGIIRSPNRYSPFRNPGGARNEMNAVLDRMVETKRLSAEIAAEGKAVMPMVRPENRRTMADNWAMELVRGELNLILDEIDIVEGGLRVFTTLDLDLQTAAETALEDHLAQFEQQKGYKYPTRAQHQAKMAETPKGEDVGEPEYLQGAVVFIDNTSGGLRAVVGGRDVRESRFNRAIQAKRQVGSLFKPFVYAAAFEAGLSPNAQVDDGPIRAGEIRGAPRNWRPQNSDGTFGGMQPVATGLVRSRNTMSVRVGNAAGLERVRAVADRAGVASSIPRYPAVYLGAFESSLRDMTSAYTCFPNRGQRARPHVISEIQDRYGRRVFLTTRFASQSLGSGAATFTSRILSRVMQPGGTGASVSKYGVNFPTAGKTGTTDNYRDAWFVGYSDMLTGGVWVGFDNTQRGLAQGYGARLSLPVWAQVMAAAQKAGYQFGPLP